MVGIAECADPVQTEATRAGDRETKASLAQEGYCQAPLFSRLKVAGVMMPPKDETTKALLPSRGSGDAGVNQINAKYEDWRVLVFSKK
jgi:hypothetical protein